MKNEMSRNDWSRLLEIQEEMLDLIDQAKTLVRRSGNVHEYECAKAYWIANIEMALSNEHDYVGHAGRTFAETIGALEPSEEEEEEEI